VARDEILARLQKVYPDTEEAVELSTMLVFDELGWDLIHAENEKDGDPTLLSRQDQSEVVLKRFLFPAFRKLNPDMPEEALDQAVDIITRDRSAMSITVANRDVSLLLRQGVQVTFRDNDGNQKIERVRLIDWKGPGNNHFLLVSQFWVNGDPYKRRGDLVGFVNGIPLLFIELKAPHVNAYDAFKSNFQDYKSTIPQLFWYNGFNILSNGSEAKIGSVSAPWEHFGDWKKINDEGEEGVISLDTLIRGTCEKARFLDILENFNVFMEAPGGLIKIVAKNHQYLGVNNAIAAVKKLQENRGKLGVFWHTQGSGKSASMMFFSQKVLRKIPGNWTFVIVTDRAELDDQIYETFQKSGIITEGHVQADSSRHLRQLLTEDHRFVFTLIHKFRTEGGEKHPVLSLRDNIIIITDEAHRSQYDALAQNMRDALPNAAFIGFTGTPLIRGEEEKTREVFGDYVSIYNFGQSIEDGATVPLYYENRIPEIQLTNEALNADLNKLIDEAMLDPEQERKLERDFSKMYQIVTRDDRLEKIAIDIVDHFINRGFKGKGMVVAIDKATAVKMYDKVKKHWQATITMLKKQAAKAEGDSLQVLQDKIQFMETTVMAVVVSQAQNEVEELKKKGVNIVPHRHRMVHEDLATKFKTPDNPFRIAFVCAMWMTGFDVPSCSTIYLDKPMKNHTLMQTIARANRVFQDKRNGLIVDYVGVFRDLEQALAIYAAPTAGKPDVPIRDKAEIMNHIVQSVLDITKFLETNDVQLEKIRQMKDIFERTKLKNDAVDIIVANDDTRKKYLHLADALRAYYRAYLPDPVEKELAETAYLIRKIAATIRSLASDVDVSEVMTKVEALLDESVKGFLIPDLPDDVRIYDLSEIDFERLQERFIKNRKRIELERLKSSIEKKLEALVQANRTRIDFKEKYEEMIAEYHTGAKSLEEIFKKLLDFSQALKDEERRYIREELSSEEELAIFDLLTKPDMKLSKAETREVKRIARRLLDTLRKEKLVLDWKKKQQTRAAVKVAIADTLDDLPQVYTKEIYNRKCDQLYQYVYDLEAGFYQVPLGAQRTSFEVKHVG
jgi:type I restriction enzyme R subunit